MQVKIQIIKTYKYIVTYNIIIFHNKMIFHESKDIELHDKIIDVDLNLIELITKINKNKLITRGCCENRNESYEAYIIFEYNDFVELLKNIYIFEFVNKFCITGNIYYAANHYRHLQYNKFEYDEKLKNETEIWISITFPTNLIKDFENIIDKSEF